VIAPIIAILGLASGCWAQPKSVLFVTHSAGFRHGSIETARRVLTGFPSLRVTATEDLSQLVADRLRFYDAVFFYTSGELAISPSQRQDLLDYVRSGKGFGGVHSATDTLYGWEEYGDLIGGYFDGHPWTEVVRIDVEDPSHPAVRHLPLSFPILEEIYQFRAWDRRKVRVLLTLDTTSVDMTREGVNRKDGDFALAWCREYGSGRVYYNALGHFDETWLDVRFQSMIYQALLWLVREADAPAAPRIAKLEVTAMPALAPGAVVRIEGRELTMGDSAGAAAGTTSARLVGTSVRIAGRTAPLFGVEPGAVIAQVPFGLAEEQVDVVLRAGGAEASLVAPLRPTAPLLLAAVGEVKPASVVTLYVYGLGEVDPPVPAGTIAPLAPLSHVRVAPRVSVGGKPAILLFAGLAPDTIGMYVANVRIPEDAEPGSPITIE
jgi:uncharacterized protein (TIGR03437 family)